MNIINYNTSVEVLIRLLETPQIHKNHLHNRYSMFEL